MSESTQRWEVSILIGPCTQTEAEAFFIEASDLVYEHVETKHGAVFGFGPWDEGAEQTGRLRVAPVESGAASSVAGSSADRKETE